MERSFVRNMEGLSLRDGAVLRCDGTVAATNVQFRGEDAPTRVSVRFTNPTREPASVH